MLHASDFGARKVVRVLVHENKRGVLGLLPPTTTMRMHRVVHGKGSLGELDFVASIWQADELRLEVTVRQRPARDGVAVIQGCDLVGGTVPAAAGGRRKLDAVERLGAIWRR